MAEQDSDAAKDPVGNGDSVLRKHDRSLQPDARHERAHRRVSIASERRQIRAQARDRRKPRKPLLQPRLLRAVTFSLLVIEPTEVERRRPIEQLQRRRVVRIVRADIIQRQFDGRRPVS